MNIIKLILDDCSDEEKRLITPSLANLYPSRDSEADAIHSVPTDNSPRNPFLECIEKAERDESRHYERLAEARARFFALHPERDDGRVIDYRPGWWDANGFGAVHYQDVPEYRFRGQDLDVSADLIAKDRRYERTIALAKRQATWNRVNRSMRSGWKASLTRGLKSG